MKVGKYLVITLLIVFFLAGTVLTNASPANYWDDNSINLDKYTKSILDKSNTKNFSLAPGDPVNFDASQIAGANYLRQMQADITEDNAGNGNPDVPDDPDDGGWDWSSTTFTHSTGASPTNIYGATVLGVYYTYMESPDPALFTVMLDAADHIVSTGPGVNRSGADMKFLLLFNELYNAEVSITTVYADAAKAKYDGRITTYGTATALAEAIRDFRAGSHPNGIIGWDIGIYSVIAQKLFGIYGVPYDTDADDIAEVLWQDSYNSNPGYFDVVADAGWDPTYADVNFWWYTLGLTGLIDAFEASGSHTAEIPDLVTRLLASQFSGGGISFSYGANTDDEDWQSTGYAMTTLGNLDQATHQDDLNRMGYWLGATQDASGGWVYSSGTHYPEIGGECTAGLYFTTNVNADVIADDDFASQADVDIYNTANSTSYVWGFNAFATIQAAIDAVNGSTVFIANGSYLETLSINMPLTLTGESEAGVIINIPPAGGYGILVTSGDVLMENCTLATNASNENFPIHARGTSNSPTGFSNLTLQNITISNAHRRTGFDIHGFTNVLLTSLTSQDAWGGNGLQVTGCVDVTIDNITTSGNAWGSMAIYSSGPSYLNRGSDNVIIDGNTLSLGEGVLFNQDEFGLTNTNITVVGYEYMVRNLAFRPDASGFYFYLDTYANAVVSALGLEGIAPGSFIYSLANNNEFFVAPDITMQAAIDAATAGGTINVTTGTHIEPAQIVIDKDLTIFGDGKALTTLTAGFNTTAGYYLTTDAFIYVMPGVDVTIEDLSIDGTGFTMRHAIQSRGTNLTVRDCDISNTYASIYAGRGIVFLSGTGLVENCTMSNIQRIGVHISGGVEPTPPAVDVIGLTYVGKGVGDFLDYGIEFGGGGTGTAQNCTITDCYGVASSDGSGSAAILATDFYGTGTEATITDCILNNNSIGIYAGYTAGDLTVVVAHHNDLSGNDTGIFSVAAGTLNATENFWGVVTAPDVIASVDGDIAFSPWCSDASYTNCTLTSPVTESWVDINWAGSQNGDDLGGGMIFGYNAFASVQEGIDAVNGSTVHVAAGTYREQIYIDKNIDLLGAGSATCIIEAPDALNRTTYSVTQWTGSVKVIDAVIGVNAAGTVNIDGFTIDGRDTGPSNFYGVHYFSTNGSFTNCTIDNITYPAVPGAQAVVSFAGTHGVGDTYNIDVSNNTIPTFQKGGIVLMGPGCTFTVNYNTVAGVASSTIAGNCIQLSYGASGSTLGNYVEGTSFAGTGWASTGILLFESGDVSMVDDEVYNCQNGVNFSDWGWGYSNPTPVNLSFTNLNLHDNEWTVGVQLSRDNSHANIIMTDCDILNNGGDGIDLYGTGVDPWGGSYYTGWSNGSITASITGCTITNSLYDGLWTADLSGNLTNTSSIEVHESAFIGNTLSGINNTLPETIDATQCYWEDPAAPLATAKTSTLQKSSNMPSPFGDDLPSNAAMSSTKSNTLTSMAQALLGTILGPVAYSPYWTQNYIGDPHTSPWTWGVDNTGTIQAGIDAAIAGDFIDLAAGTYAEGPQIHVDKSLALTGQGSVTITPIANTGSSGDSRGWFLVDAGVLLDFSNVTLDGAGFDIYQGIRSHGGGTYDNIFFQNFVHPGYAGVGLAVFGSENVSRTNCVFTNMGRIGALLFGSGLTDSYFMNNTYTGKGDGDWLDYAADISAGAVVTVDNCIITNCTGVASSDGSTSAGLLVSTFFGSGTTATITNSILDGNTVGIAVGYDNADESIVNAHNNSIANNTSHGISTSGPLVVVNAENNYWGALDGPLDAAGTMEAVIGGTCYAVGDITNQVAEGFPVDGLGNQVDDGVVYCPWIATDVFMSPGDIVYMCDGDFEIDVALNPSITDMKSISIRLSYPAGLSLASMVLADANYASAPIFIWDNATGYDSVQIDMFVQSGLIDGFADLFTVSFNGTSDICVTDMITMTRAVWKAGVSNDDIIAAAATPITITADCADPVVTINGPVDGGFYNIAPALDISTSDNCDIDYLYYQINSDGWVAILSSYAGNSYADAAWQISTVEFDNLTEDAHCLQFRVVDDLGREGLSASWCFNKDVTAPETPTDFVAEPGHNKVKLSWTNSTSADVIGVHIQRTPWGDYPTYSTSEPAYPSAYNVGTNIFSAVGSSTVDQAGMSNTSRDVYYYSAFAYDAAGNYSALSTNAQARSTSYWLGDIADNIFTLGNYDGFVHVGDLTVFATTYWKTTGDAGFIAEADFGPTVGALNSARGIPTPDDSISFTDLGIFAINYQSVDNLMKAVPLFTNTSVNGALNLSLEPQIDGDIVTCEFKLNNNTDETKIVHLVFEYPDNLIYEGYESKIANEAGGYPIFSKARKVNNRIEFDMAIMGQGISMSGSGALASFKFKLSDNNAVVFDFVEAFVFDNNLEELSAELVSGKIELIPERYSLSQNYPNPFNPSTEIAYQLPQSGKVTLEIFNLLGQRVITLVDSEQEANSYVVSWNGQNESGIKVSSGVYLYRLQTNDFAQTKKMILFK